MTSYDVDNGDEGADKSGTDESKQEKGRSWNFLTVCIYYYYINICWAPHLEIHLPWYNRNGWLGVKHQVTHLVEIYAKLFTESTI